MRGGLKAPTTKGEPSTAKKASTDRKTSKTSEKDLSDLDSDSGSEDEGEDGVDEEGMEKLLKALGDDGLDDMGQMQLQALDEGNQSGSDDEEEGDESGGEFVPEDVEVQEDGSESEEDSVDEENAQDESDEDEDEEGVENPEVQKAGDADDDVPLDDADSVDDDVVPRQKILTNNKEALDRIRETIKLDPKLSWTETLAVTYPESIAVDVEDDLNRELAFYKQALHGANAARKLADQHNLPFTRPSDYFAEMVKSDSHMERIRQRLLNESAVIKKSEDKRKEREGKKFGKQVQIEKQKERERSKKEMEERLKGLKRKRKDVLDDSTAKDDAFDVAVEDAISDRPSKRPNNRDGGSKISRRGRDAKFGFGGKDRRAKQNTRESTETFDFGDRKGAGGRGRGGMRGGRGSGSGRGRGAKTQRPGRGRRMTARGR